MNLKCALVVVNNNFGALCKKKYNKISNLIINDKLLTSLISAPKQWYTVGALMLLWFTCENKKINEKIKK